MTGLLTRISYFKRYRMEMALDQPLPPGLLPSSYAVLPWSWHLLDAHAEVLYASFQHEIDSKVFTSLGDLEGCRELMTAIARQKGFLADATLLLVGPEGPCATVQGICQRGSAGAIQNLGVRPELRGMGLGRALLLRALHGFRQYGLQSAFLEATAENDGAIRLYHNMGFRRTKTVYKAIGETVGSSLC